MRRQGKPPKAANNLITAQEIACWAYCPEQWRLQYGLGMPSQNQAAMAAGDRHHARKAAAEGVAGSLLTLGGVLMVAALLVLLWLVWR